MEKNCLSGESVYGMEKVAYVLNINYTNLRGRQVDAEGLLPVRHKLTARYRGTIAAISDIFYLDLLPDIIYCQKG